MKIIKFSTVLLLVVSFIFVSLLVGLFFRNRWKQTQFKTKLMSLWANWGLKTLNIEVDSNLRVDLTKENYLVVCNHLSYIDIMILSSVIPSCYVTSVEIRDTPGLGSFVKAANCLFVERRNKDNLSNEVKELTEALENGVNVTVFPEATSTNGEAVIRFRRPLFRAAIDAKKEILPLCLNYVAVDEQSVSLENRDEIFWYGDMTFGDHLWNLSGKRKIYASLSEAADHPYPAQQDEAHLAEHCHNLVSSRYQPITV